MRPKKNLMVYNQSIRTLYDEIIMLHDRAYDESTPDELFNITIAEELGEIIRTLGVMATCMPFTEATMATLKNKKATDGRFAIFNLVENVERKPEWQPRASRSHAIPASVQVRAPSAVRRTAARSMV